jgi:vancomycin aglycone glucosyltransferase
MRALLAAVGTRGDVQPALALALELRKLGHAVRMCISPNFVDWAKSLGLEALPMGVEMRMPAQGAGTTPTLTPEELRRLRESMPDLISDQFETIGAAADGCDVIVGANAHQYAGHLLPSAKINVTAVYALSRCRRQISTAAGPTVKQRRVRRPSVSRTGGGSQSLERACAGRNPSPSARYGPIDDVLEYVLPPVWLAACRAHPGARHRSENLPNGHVGVADRTLFPPDLDVSPVSRPAGFGVPAPQCHRH